MLALALLFGLIVWVIITIVAVKIGPSVAMGLYKGPNARRYGAIGGFMLTMGWVLIYWVIEFAVIQARVSYLCATEGGTTVYVTPEKYRAQIGEEEWSNLPLVNKSIPYTKEKELSIKFQGKNYVPLSQENRRIISLWNTQHGNAIYGIGKNDTIFYDVISKQVLFEQVTFGVGVPAIANSLEGLKFWLNNISDCSSADLPESIRFMVIYEYTNQKN